MHITAHYTLTADEALRGARSFKRIWYQVSVGAGVGLVLLGAYSLATGPQRVPGVFLILNGLLFSLLPEAVLRLARRRRGVDAYTPVEVVFDDEGLTLRTEASEGGLPWADFAKIQRQSGFWIFRTAPSRAVLLPERALDAAAATELEVFLRARKLMQ
ncbi:YcxB family protein [Geothrix fuzhouensis]|uniref:YcxB family protein n=1 Tax=Geothrix fuzhouensis TaxID=2966451 RepID=UPI002148A0D6|nr:YcxB family protein [Geothrix fuzhouensis]